MTAFASAAGRTPVADRLRSALRLSLVALLLGLAPAAFGQVRVGPTLQSALASASATTRLQVIVTFEGEGPLSAARVDALNALGLGGVYFRNLPIAGVVATPAQVSRIAALPGVRSLWHNDQLQYENEVPTRLTGVDRLRADSRMRTGSGLPYSGRGIGVLINDSGVDGTHPDLQYGSHVVQNVLGQTNLHAQDAMLPITFVEGVANTDIGGGHGTHVAGIIGGTGQQSGGRYEGVAPGASLIGYGSGAALFILDTIGGFDYALTHQIQYNIRVVSNSFGNTSDVGTAFDPADPTNVATKALADRGIVVVFSAGNAGSGPNTITGNFKKAPWVTLVAAGDDTGALAAFSSRGDPTAAVNTVEIDGETYAWVDRPTVTAPGVAVVSARASLGSNEPDSGLEPAFAPFYVRLDGTSMACPHISGVVALMLEADPTLTPYEVKAILERTATNMPGREGWEAGAGYVNAYAAVQAVLNRSVQPFGSTVNVARAFNANALVSYGAPVPFSVGFNPVGTPQEITFEVGPDVARVTAQARVNNGNTVALVLYDPAGNRYGSSISLPVLGPNIAASAPGMAGTWRLTVRGVGCVSGVCVDPLGLSNGVSVPGTISGSLLFTTIDGYTGLDDLEGSPIAGDVQFAVSRRLVDGLANGRFRPDQALTRAELAEYLVMGAGARQFFPTTGLRTLTDVPTSLAPYAEAVVARGAALRNADQTQNGLVRASGGAFHPSGTVSRADLAYAFVQALGLQPQAANYTGAVTVDYNGQALAIQDAAQIPAGLRGYVQAALTLGIINARFTLTQGPFDPRPTIRAYFDPTQAVTRGAYAVFAGRFYDSFLNGFEYVAPSAKAGGADVPEAAAVAAGLALEQNAPNPVAGATTFRYTLSSTADVRLVVYDAMGREVAVVAEGPQEAGSYTATWDASGLAAGVYVYRLTAGDQAAVRRMVVAR